MQLQRLKIEPLHLYVAAIAFALGGLVGAAIMKTASRPAGRDPTSMAANPGGPVLAFVRSVQGPVESRAPEAKEWTSAAKGTTAASGEELRTGPRAGAVVALRSAGRLIVGAKSHIRLLPPEVDEASGKISVVRLRLLDGALRAEAAGDAEAVIQVDTGRTTVELDLGGQVVAAGGQASGEYLFSFLDSEGFLLDESGTSRTVPQNHGVIVRDKEIGKSIKLPEAPRADDEEAQRRVYTAGEKTAKMTFVFEEPSRLRVVVATDAELTNVVAEQVGDGPDVELDVGLAPGEYYWAAARLDPATALTGRFTRTRRIQVLSGTRPIATDDAPTGRIVFPSGGSGVAFYTRNVPEIGLDWDGLSNEDGYRLVVARDRSYRRKVVDKRLQRSRYTVAELKPGAYWWRATAPSGKVHSGRFSVKRVAAFVPTDNTKSTVTEEYESARIVYQRRSPEVDFLWKRDKRVASYRLKLSRTEDFAKVLITQTVRDPKVTIRRGQLSQGTYYWRVERVMANNEVLYPGKARRLRVLFDNTVPGLEITSPRDRATITGAEVRVAGLAPPGARLSVNGRSVTINRQGQFSASLPVDPADPRLVFQMLRGASMSYYVREIRYSSSAQRP